MKSFFLITIAALLALTLHAQKLISDKKEAGAFPIVSVAGAASIYVDDIDHWVVQKAAALLQNDIERVTGKKPELIKTLPASGKAVIIIGSLDKSGIMHRLVSKKKSIPTASGINGKPTSGRGQPMFIRA